MTVDDRAIPVGGPSGFGIGAGATDTGDHEQARAGSRTLSVFGYSLNARVLRAHSGGPLLTGQLDQAIGWAPQSSLRTAVARLCELGVLARSEPDGPSQGVVAELTEAGGELLPVVAALEHWLELAPGGSLSLDDSAARGIVRALAAGWDSTAIRALAERPFTLNELSACIPGFSYPMLKRRLAKLRATEMVTAVPGGGKTASYVPNEWLRRAVGPLAAAANWEQRYDPDAEPISHLDVEAAFLLTLPLVELPKRAHGLCTLAVLLPPRPSASSETATVTAEVEHGTVISCGLEREPEPEEWALGTIRSWFDAVLRGHVDSLRLSGGDQRLARRVVKGLYNTLRRA